MIRRIHLQSVSPFIVVCKKFYLVNKKKRSKRLCSHFGYWWLKEYTFFGRTFGPGLVPSFLNFMPLLPSNVSNEFLTFSTLN